MKSLPMLPIMAGVQEDHADSSLALIEDKYSPSDTYQEIKIVADDLLNNRLQERFVFLNGKPGVGKTLALVGLFRLQAYVDRGVLGSGAGYYATFAGMTEDIIGSFTFTHSTRIAVAHYFPIKFLFLDDISRGEKKLIDLEKIEGQIFKEIILNRWEEKKHLICTSNYDSPTLQRMIKNVFGSYVHSRVLGSSKFIDFPDIGDQRRRKEK